jgi:cyclic beta-1,2-glucan synthetase
VQFRSYLSSLGNTAEQCFYAASFLPFKAVQMTDAVVRTLYRLIISHKRLLEWETAAATESRLGRSRWSLLRDLSVCSIVAVTIFFLIDNSAKLAAAPWLCMWLIAPIVGHLISLPRKHRVTQIQNADRDWLAEIASGTWAYFEQFVNPEGNWLPPDNVQDYPREKVAFRISPTNEGLFLVSGLVARRMGFIGLESLVELWEKNLASWKSLDQLHGHHFNWYETSDLRALHPYYVSTVDSGNLMACYFTLCEGIAGVGEQPLIDAKLASGARASLRWLKQRLELELFQVDDDAQDPVRQRAHLKELGELIVELLETIQFKNETFTDLLAFLESLNASGERLLIWAAEHSQMPQKNSWNDAKHVFLRQVRIVAERFHGIQRDADQFWPWLKLVATLESHDNGNQLLAPLRNLLTPGLGLRELAMLPMLLNATGLDATGLDPAGRDVGVRKAALTTTTTTQQSDVSDLATNVSSVPVSPEQLYDLIRAGSRAARSLLDRLTAIRTQCESAASRMDFRFLYNGRRKLFSIGYNVDIGTLDRGHYDLLCSECRIASYLAIAKGDVDTEHWFRLGRQATLIDGKYTLLSWGGTMFEFLMPQLFLRSYEGSLIDTSCRTAIQQQIDYGRSRHMPWGVSESAYSAMASNSDYQYKSFGVPGLGLKRGLSRDIVVSPYSTALALAFQPKAATSNLKRLASVALGRWGFYDAVDYTPGRLRRNHTENVVRNYMAHHQGMSLLAIANVTDDQLVSRWFHAHPLVRANELLLQERVPSQVDAEVPNADEVHHPGAVREETTLVSRQITGVHSGTPRILLLSNGQFSSLLTHTGGSYSRYKDQQVTRWRSDSTRDCWGSFIYLHDRDSGTVWSATYQPTRVQPDRYEVLFSVDKGEVHRRQGDIETVVELVVSPDQNAEVRQLRITNHGTTRRRIEVTSYVEVVLASQAADIAHPAFQKLFVETEYIAEDATLIARRRPRDSQQNPGYALHTLAVPSGHVGTVDYESSREKFLGRGRTVESPLAMEMEKLSQTTGAVLDAVFSLRCVLTINPTESVTLGLTTAVADTREQALALADLFHDLRGVQRAFELAWAFTQIELRHLGISAREVHLFQQLGGHLLYPDASLRGDSTRISANQLGQNALWRFGISGDVPILLLRIMDVAEVEFARTIITAHYFLMSRGLIVDLVISNDFPGAYYDSLQDLLLAIVNERAQSDVASKRVVLLRGAQLTAEDHQLLDATAAVLLRANRGSLAQQMEAATVKNRTTSVPGLPRTPTTLLRHRMQPHRPEQVATPAGPGKDREFFNGTGAFIDQGRCYEMIVNRGNETPAPWSNVMANANFGCLLSESGGGYTWFGNSRENKLTAWSNDPTSDPASEILYLRDLQGDFHWSPVSSLGRDLPRRVVHGQGYTLFGVEHKGIRSEVFVSVHATEPLKIVRVRLHNSTGASRTLQLTYYAETVMGVSREETSLHQVSSLDAERAAVMMGNGYHPDFKTQCMFLTILNADDVSWTGDRRSFIGRDGSLNDPVSIRRGLNQRVGAGLDPCLAMQGTVSIAAGQTEEVFVLIGAGRDRSAAAQLLDQYRQSTAAAEASGSGPEYWNQHLSALTVETPNRALDVMLNRWLPYQILSCRVWGRSAFYQSGGAYGFRDQLQDVMALVYSRPDLAREQILNSASRQYAEGDVQHWWHPPSGKGTRTRFSDDFLFLPFVVLHYLKVTGDRQILEVQIRFIESPRLNEHEQERYEQPPVSENASSLLDHCLRAMQHGLRYGEQNLPLMGCGDWNDGMNRVGEGGQGQSVWVAWFQIAIFEGFASLLRELNLREFNAVENAEKYEQQAKRLRAAIDEVAWDGEWYRRAFFDDGSPLGSHCNDECQIDSLAQSWAVIAGGVNPRSREAFESAVRRLVNTDANIIQLFDPPFDKTTLDPGYVKGYLPGVRENGGQYSHAAMWMVQAAALLGDGVLAMNLFDLLNPIHHADTAQKAEQYKVEPYVIAADVYVSSQHLGRGGWSWYTGAAGWMYRVAIENMLGIRIESNRLSIAPVLPASWTQFRFSYRRNTTTWNVHAIRTSGNGSRSDSLTLVEDGELHNVQLEFQ